MNEMNFDKGTTTCVTIMNDLFLRTAGNRGYVDNIPGKAIMAMLDFTDMNELASSIGNNILHAIKKCCDSYPTVYTEDEIKDCIKSFIESKETVRDLYFSSKIEPYSSFYYFIRKVHEGIGNALYDWSYSFGYDSRVDEYVRKYMSLALM